MSKCKECGHQMDDDVQVCPNCGCPVENETVPEVINNDVLSKGKSTEAEEIVSKTANSIMRYCNFMAWACIVISFIGGIILITKVKGESSGLLFPASILVGFFSFIIWRFLGKIIWGVIMLFVNISTTLKRIEIKLEEQNGTH